MPIVKPIHYYFFCQFEGKRFDIVLNLVAWNGHCKKQFKGLPFAVYKTGLYQSCFCCQIEGEFEGRRSDVAFTRGDRVDVVRHKDNLKMEGEFHLKKDQVVVTKGERAVVKKQEDKLKLVKADILHFTHVSIIWFPCMPGLRFTKLYYHSLNILKHRS